jgi:hypothetical protein
MNATGIDQSEEDIHDLTLMHGICGFRTNHAAAANVLAYNVMIKKMNKVDQTLS